MGKETEQNIGKPHAKLVEVGGGFCVLQTYNSLGQVVYTSEKFIPEFEKDKPMELINPQIFWQEVTKSWEGGVNVVLHGNPHINPQTKALVALCPLYASGGLAESKLLLNPSSIAESRVGNKWKAITQVTAAINDQLQKAGGNLELFVVFANKGVLLGKEPTAAEEQALVAHDMLYKDVVSNFCKDKGITLKYYNYGELGVHFPTFVDLRKPVHFTKEMPGNITKSGSDGVWCLNNLLEQYNIPTVVPDNKDSRHVMTSLFKMQGISYSGIFNLAIGYLAFDHMIPGLLDNDQEGIYLTAERFAPLLGIPALTPDLKKLRRVCINA